MSRKARQPSHGRADVAARAARLLAEGGAADFDGARRKAARDLGLDGARDLPDNLEIHRALAEHLMLFDGARHPARVARLREAALVALEFFAPFEPRLTGPVLYGTACEHAGIDLQLASDEVEAVTRFLLEHGRPYALGEVRERLAGEASPRRLPTFTVDIAGERVTALVLPARGTRQILGSLDGKPVRRMGARALRDLLDSGQTFAPEHADG